MADEDLLNDLVNRELETMELFFSFKAQKSAITIQEFIDTSLSQGADPRALRIALADDLKNGGRIFGEFKRLTRMTAHGSINRARDAGQFAENDVTVRYRWIAILVNTCDDCLSNHGDINTWEEWGTSRFGRPRSGGTICRENCKCILSKEENTELEPIFRERDEE